MAGFVLRVTPETLERKAGEISTEIEAVKTAFDKIDEEVRGSKQYWEGDASDAHIKYYNSIKDELYKTVSRLKENPKKLLTMAGIYKEGENENKATAQILSADIIL